ncbi:MAG: hypothetical protein AB2809_20425 [Candidatus Thiodiazotropha sp.]
MNICLIGNAADRERFAMEAQTRHGFSILYNLDEFELAAQRDGRYIFLGCSDTQSVDMRRVRIAGTVIFVTDEMGCCPGDFIFRAGARKCDYSVALYDLILAISDEEIHAQAQA